MVKKIIITIVILLATTQAFAIDGEKPILVLVAQTTQVYSRLTLCLTDAFWDEYRIVDGGYLTENNTIPNAIADAKADFALTYDFNDVEEMIWCRVISKDGRWTTERCDFTNVGIGQMLRRLSKWTSLPETVEHMRSINGVTPEEYNRASRERINAAGITPGTSFVNWLRGRRD